MTAPAHNQARGSAAPVVVAYASKHGSTREIAERIAAVLRENGLEAAAVAAGKVDDLTPYRAVILGSAVYMARWRPDAWSFVRRHRRRLASMPLWLFSSGPVGEPAKQTEQPPAPLRVRRVSARLGAREHVTFGGRVPLQPSGLIDRAVAKKVPAENRDARDWDAIEAWARGIAAELGTAGTGSTANGSAARPASPR